MARSIVQGHTVHKPMLHLVPDSGDFDDALVVRSIQTLYKVHDQPLVTHELQERPLPWEIDNSMADALKTGVDTLICGLRVDVLLDFFTEERVRSILRPIEVCWWQVLPPGGKSCGIILNQIAAGILPSSTKIQYFARITSSATWKSLDVSGGSALSQVIKDSILHKIPEVDDGYFKYKDAAGNLRYSIVVGLSQLGSEQARAFQSFLKLFPVKKAMVRRFSDGNATRTVSLRDSELADKQAVWWPSQVLESGQDVVDVWETKADDLPQPPPENDFITEEIVIAEPQDPSHWSMSFANNQHLPVLTHIDKYGCITEVELIRMLGSSRAGRKFTLMLEEYSKQLPFDIKVRPSASGSRYTKANS
jgi:hypothetical protein